jgi:uncharacterized sporulation protein YeaH/YhbH (DUF444 family)
MQSYFIIDRRLNPKGKSIANRQRFLRRTRAHIRDAVKKAVGERKIGEPGSGESINVPSKNVAEPRFQHAARGGDRVYVLPGNKEYSTGDRIPKPTGGSGKAEARPPTGATARTISSSPSAVRSSSTSSSTTSSCPTW